MNRRHPLGWGLILAGMLAIVPALSAPGSAAATDPVGQFQTLTTRGGPVTITAEQMSFANQSGRVTFSGQVQITRDDMTMRAQKVNVLLRTGDDGKGSRHIRRIVAEGSVVFIQGARRATAGRAEYDPETESVVLSESPTVTDDNLELVGRRITIDLATQKSTVEGGAFTFTEPAKPASTESAQTEPTDVP